VTKENFAKIREERHEKHRYVPDVLRKFPKERKKVSGMGPAVDGYRESTFGAQKTKKESKEVLYPSPAGLTIKRKDQR